jgi:flagellar biosynthesis/type III secretory pathway protein FliH
LSNVLHMHRRAPIRVIRKAPPKPEPVPVVHHREPRLHTPHVADVAHASAVVEPSLEPYRIPVDDEITEERLVQEFERGRLQGHAEAAMLEADRERAIQDAAHDRVAVLLENLTRETGRFTGELEKEAYRFAVAVAERIVKREIALDESVVMRQMREAVRRIVGVETITVRVHPDDEALVRSHRAALLSSSDSVREILIEGDETIDRGGCILESATGNVDARIGSQLRQIETALFGPQLPSEEEAG